MGVVKWCGRSSLSGVDVLRWPW